MISVQGFVDLNIIHQSKETLVFSAVSAKDKTKVTLKCLRPEVASPEYAARYKQEYELLKSLNSEYVIRPIELIEQDNCPVLVFEQFDSPSLAKALKIKRLKTVDTLKLCCEISSALDYLHSNNVIHKHLATDNILYNEKTKKIKLIDFEIAGYIDASKISGANDSLMGTLHYISPEQTGRTNRTVDYRTDFYSLGALFYELLTGNTPFESSDSMQLIYYQIVRQPIPPNEIDATIPTALSDIALKLLEKNPEDRYQSAYAINQDLTLCIEAYENANPHEPLKYFSVALDDIPEQLNISEKLLEREAELATLNKILGLVRQGENENVLCIGTAGSGKSALVREFRRNLADDSAYFVHGRQNIINSSVPYSGLLSVLRGLCKQLISHEDITLLGQKLRTNLDTNLELLIAMLPELTSIVGDPRLKNNNAINPLESRNRVAQGIAEFIRTVTCNNKIVILHIENLQWIDNASIEILKLLMLHHKIPGLMIIGSYRREELPESHPTRQSLRKLLINSTRLTTINIENLNPNSIASIISESLFRSKEEAHELANTVHLKTGGNPLAVREFITTLHLKGIISFNKSYRDWHWDNELALKEPPTKNVGELLAKNIVQLDPDISNLLQIAACIGDKISLDLLRSITQDERKKLSEQLSSAVRSGYLAQIQNVEHQDQDIEYVFSHGGIQQAAYSLLSAEKRLLIHSRIGHSYLQNFKEDPDGNIFEMVNQLNNSFENLIFERAEVTQNKIDIPQGGKPLSIYNTEDIKLNRIELAKLNQTAGKKAKESGAFQAAFKYLRTAIVLQGQEIWDHHEASFELHQEAAEVAHLCGDKTQLNLLVTALIKNSINNSEMVRSYESKMKALIAFDDLTSAQEAGHKALILLNSPISIEPTHVNRAILLIRLLYLTTLMNLPNRPHKSVMVDEEKKATMRVLTTLCQVSYLKGDENVADYILKMTELSLKYGTAPESSFAYPLFGAVLITYFGTIEAGYKFGVLALNNLNESNRALHCKTITVVTNFINIWKHPYRDSLEPLANAYEIGMESGDIEFALIAAITSSANAFVLGNDLNGITANLEIYNQQAREFNQTPMLSMGSIYQQAITNLIETTEDPWIFEGPIYDEDRQKQIRKESGDKSSETNLYILKLFLTTLFHKNELALIYARTARKGILSVASSSAIAFFTLYESIALIANLNHVGLLEKAGMNIRIRMNLRKLRKWTRHAPQNTLHAYHLVKAEIACHNHNKISAIENYEKSMLYANQYGFIKELAFSCELAGRFYASDNKKELALHHFRKARESYIRWGATTKVRSLDRDFIELGGEHYLSDNGSDLHIPSYLSTGSTIIQDKSQASHVLDFGTVLKATQALSGEIILSTLLEKLMEVSLENAGGHAASLILKDNDHLYLEINSRFTGSITEHSVQKLSLQNTINLPISIIQYVARTKEDIVLNDPSVDDIFTQDKYLLTHHPKSILCVPILSKAHLTGVLYLENLKSTHTFSQDRIALLKLLASQAAIAIENAKLYQQLKDSRNRYLSLYENAVEGIFEIGLDGSIITLNPSAKKLTGYSSHAAKSDSFTIKPELFFVNKKHQSEIIELLANNEPVVGFETTIRRMDNREIWVVLSAHMVLDEDKKPLQIEGSIIDITERKMREEAEQEKKLAIAATETKSRFLANMSHEIRTPMNAIIGYTNLALSTELTKKQLLYLSTIQSSSSHLLSVVNDILDISRVESGNLELQQIAFRVTDIIEDIRNLFNYDAEKKNIEFILPSAAELYEEYLVGDPSRISQILINLVSNALKFTEKGSITVGLESMPLQSGSTCLNFSVKDTGIGINNSNIELIFDSFTQGENTNIIEGSGLGLSISKRLVEMMQGHIHAVSEPGVGSNFYFSVVVEPWLEESTPKEDVVISSPAQASNGQNLLIVEDNEINLNLAKEVLHNAGYEIHCAVNGAEAIKILEKEVFFAVLMDLRMPIMDGIEAIKHIRSQAALKRLPVIALSAGVLQHEVDEALQSGFDHYISKPVDFDSLLTLLNEIAGIKDIPKVNLRRETYRTKYQIRGIDFDKALSNHDHDEVLFTKLSGEFIRIYEHADREFCSLLAIDGNGDPTDSDLEREKEKAERLMHNVAGVAGNFGGLNLMEAARALEHQLAKNNEPSKQNLTSLSLELENFVQAIKEYHVASDVEETPLP